MKPKNPICAKHNDGWCATDLDEMPEDNLNTPTVCGMYVWIPLDMRRRRPTCPECLEILKERKTK